MRPVVAYDDLNPAADPPQNLPMLAAPSTQTTSAGPRLHSPPFKQPRGQYSQPPKKRKREGPYTKRAPPLPVQHWDDPGTNQDYIMYDEHEGEDATGDVFAAVKPQEEDESRELTHEEIWDDSALVAAWDAANEEYEAMHGRGKKWKRERIHQSPLWYNVPPEKLSTKTNGTPATASLKSSQNAGEADSQPLDFNSFIPSHDPSLASHLPTAGPQYPAQASSSQMQHLSQTLTEAPTSNVSADEAFSQALNSMYWVGYWTATYHAQRRNEISALNDVGHRSHGSDGEQADDDLEDVEAVGDDDDLVSTQRA